MAYGGDGGGDGDGDVVVPSDEGQASLSELILLTTSRVKQ